MKLLTYRSQGTVRWGAAIDGGIVDLSRRLPGIASVKALLEGGEAALQQARAALAGTQPDVQLSDVQLLVPVQQPEKILCIGVNYAHRNAEYKDGSALPQHPSIFVRFPDSFVGHGEPLLAPPESQQLDYEGEIVIAIGRSVRRAASREEALAAIGGLTIMNEGTIRDWVHHAKFNVTQGKNWQGSGAIGPWIVTADELTAGYDSLHLTTHVNGELRQDDTTANLMFDFAHLVTYLSTFITLKPGDLIATGTPIGAGVRFDPPRFLQAGDRVEVTVDGIGTLSNPVRDEEVTR
ncbi:MAG: 2-hydroxyhepta-2,4-diene-1,7-dioate isomerase [Variovorax paradoxus]|nr:MAG: 2-hydroxyhepta-2,4-diene-1,7-dioate isomerase [Variovorax paradoxus]PZQ09514.1 MAG: 2-hydroxyhepta-2,4-diene-1,7-dioate isomerase [Variovorax paradoxus]